jgi:hypothetical protein
LHNLNRIDIHPAFAFVAVETNATRFLREKRMVTPYTYILSGNVLGSALAHDDGSRFDELLVPTLETQSFGVTVAAVLGGALSFFMCHN